MADSFEPAKRGQAFSLYGLVAVLAPSLGPTIGGWITDNYSWRWIFYINVPVGILAFLLVRQLVQDPPWIKPDRANLKKLDYIGLGLLTVAMGGMQIMLDKGEENDWFASTFIRSFCLLFVAGMSGLIWWQWRARNPIMNLKLFKYRNFAICCLLMILVGGVLNAATVLEPQFLQQLMGYTATLAGQALMGGGLALVVIMPLAGVATGRLPARNLAAFGFVCFAGAFYYTSTHFSLTMTFGFASWLRILQMAAIPFAFIAITTAAYVGLPKDASNQVAGIINFVRNVGGSIFIAVTGAIVTNRSLIHQAHMQEHMQPGNLAYAIRLKALAGAFGGGTSGPGAAEMAHGVMYQQLIQQAAAQAYQDIYRLLSWMAMGMVACAFLLSKNKPGEGASAREAMH
jgi:DHA2 family multidrug resistance protein